MQSDGFIPRRLDDAWKIGLWDVDVATPALFGFFLGWMSSTKLGFAIAAGLGIYASRWVSRLKSDKHSAYFLHWAYWSLPANPMTALRATPPSHIRRMVG